MKKITGIFLMLLIAVTLHAEEEDFSFPVSFKGTEPTIADFFTAICNREEPGEWIIFVGED